MPLDEGTGTAAHDYSGKGNHATLTNCAWVNGVFGNATLFDGSTSYATIGDNSTLDLTNDYTIAMWINLTDNAENYVYHKWLSYHFRVDTNFIMVMYVGGNAYYSQSSNVVPTGIWTHLAATYSVAEKKIRLYINGTECSYTTQNAVPSPYTVDLNTNDVIIGKAQVDVHYLDGSLDDIRVYDWQLDSGEIDDLYNYDPTPTPEPYTNEEVLGISIALIVTFFSVVMVLTLVRRKSKD